MTYAVRFLLMLCVMANCPWAAAAEQILWAKTYRDALSRASSEKKPLVLDFSASWCGYCRRMAQEVYPDPEFVAFSRAAVFIRYFADRDPEGGRLARNFRVRGFPTLVILDPKGEEVDRLVGARSKRQLITELKSIFADAVAEGDLISESTPPAKAQNTAAKPAAAPKETVIPRAEVPAAGAPPPEPATNPKPVVSEPASRVKPGDDKDPIAGLEKRLASAQSDSEKNWLNLMLGIAHLQAQHWKEARQCLGRVLERDPQNAAALDALKTLDKFSTP